MGTSPELTAERLSSLLEAAKQEGLASVATEEDRWQGGPGARALYFLEHELPERVRWCYAHGCPKVDFYFAGIPQSRGDYALWIIVERLRQAGREVIGPRYGTCLANREGSEGLVEVPAVLASLKLW